VQRFGVTKEQEEDFKMCLVKAMVTSCIAFNFAENGYLAKALAILGMTPLTRKQVAGTYLDQIAAGEQEWSRKAIESMEYPPGASDGWRKKYCVSGAGLMNFTVMGDNGMLAIFCAVHCINASEPKPLRQVCAIQQSNHCCMSSQQLARAFHACVCRCHTAVLTTTHSTNAGALLYDVRNCSDERKDGEGIARILSAAGIDIMGDTAGAAEFGGWCIDGTKANRSAIRLLEEEHPSWINTTCVAHGGALAIKDFCKVVKTTGRYSKTYGCVWIKDVNERANTIANYVQDSGNAKVIVQKHQKDIYGAKKAIDVSAPTRFASHVFVQKGVQRSSAALKQAASDVKWADLGGNSMKVC
jgi:hypothetical protein